MSNRSGIEIISRILEAAIGNSYADDESRGGYIYGNDNEDTGVTRGESIT
jgi:hypothetical protein